MALEKFPLNSGRHINDRSPRMNLLHRPRRLRSSPELRALVRETKLAREDFILPLFVSEKVQHSEPVASMPGVHQLSESALIEKAKAAYDDGVASVILFGIPM